MRFTFQFKLTAAVCGAVLVALGGVSAYFLDFYRNEKLAQIFENELVGTVLVGDRIENLILTAAAAPVDRLRKSRDFVFTADAACGQSPAVTVSERFAGVLEKLGRKPGDWLALPELRAACAKGGSPGAVVLRSGPRLHVPTILVLTRAGQVERLSLVSLDGIADSSGVTSFMVAGNDGSPVWWDGTDGDAQAMLDANGITKASLETLVSRSAAAGTPSVTETGRAAIVASSPIMATLLLVSITPKRFLLASIDFVFLQTLLLLGGFLAACLLVGRRLAIALSVPLSELGAAAERFGGGDLSTRLLLDGPPKDEIAVVKATFNSMADRIVTLVDETKHQAKVDADIFLAQQVQEMLIPERALRLDGHELHSYVKMADRCGGDWWGYLQVRPDGRKPIIVVLAGDVTGHGVSSALLTAAAQGALGVLTSWLAKEPLLALDPAALLKLFNQALFRTSKGSIQMTLFACSVDLEAGVLRASNGGHCFPYLIPPGGALQSLNIGSTIVGATLDQDFPEPREFPWPPGSQLFIYSDGLIEWFKGDETAYDRRALQRAIRGAGGARGAALLSKVLEDQRAAVAGLAQEDDVTAIVLIRTDEAAR